MNEEPTIREMLEVLSKSLSQIQISKLTTIPQSSISKILNGELIEVAYSKGRKLQRLYEQMACA
ncbi:transcriptional regulator [Acinetobacter faecalis]|uniref:transcriptional regulator n=1 Tax=Acinetobacter faecalis TaxID=2665161 RepID=UPI002A915553|nr:transcriptional regulator [Acinetobacter faecalis]MDY6469153.1 transcriptional regulator [Acinetobacter faecalis]